MQALSEIVKIQRLSLLRHFLRLPEGRPTSVVINWVPESGYKNKQ